MGWDERVNEARSGIEEGRGPGSSTKQGKSRARDISNADSGVLEGGGDVLQGLNGEDKAQVMEVCPFRFLYIAVQSIFRQQAKCMTECVVVVIRCL